jgi:hypothetical protein
LIKRDRASINQRHINKLSTHAIQRLKQLQSFGGVSHHIGHNTKSTATKIPIQQFDHGIGICDRTWLIANHKQNLMRGANKIHDRI